MSGSPLVGVYAVISVVLATGFAVGILAGPYRAIERSDYMTYHVAARIVLAGDGDCLYDAECQAAAQRELIGEEPTFERGALPYNSPPWLAALVTPLGTLPLHAAFVVFTLAGLAVLARAAWRLAPGEGAARALAPLLLLSAWPTVIGAIRGQSTLLVAGLLGLSVATTRYRSGAALGLSALKPTLGPLWALWQMTGGHWRAVATAVAVLVGLIGVGLIVVGPTALAEYPAHLVGVGGEDALGVHPEQMVNWRGAAERLGAGAWLQWVGTAATLAVVAYAWLKARERRIGAATAFLATPLVIPHANQHEAILGALGVLMILAVVRDRRWAGAAVGLHALLLLLGPVTPGEASAWLLFATLLAWLGAAAWLAAQRTEPA